MGGAPVERRRQSGASVELTRVPARRVPIARGMDEVLVEPAPLGVLFEPSPQARPFAQQCLVCDLDRPFVRGHEPAVDEDLERRESLTVALGVELVQRDPAAHEARSFVSGIGQPHQDPLRGDALRLGQPRVGGLGEPAHGAAHPARALVRGPAHHMAVALAPLFEQGGGQQRQAAGLVEHIDDEGVCQGRLHPQSHPARRLDDGPAQLVAPHRADEHLVRSDEPREPVVGRAVPVEVGAHRDHHLDAPVTVLRQCHERLEKVRPLTLVTADGEHLLELIYREQGPLAALRQRPVERRPEDARRGASMPEPKRPSPGALRSRAPAAGRRAPPRTSRSPRVRRRQAAVSPRAGQPAPPRAALDRRSTPRELHRRW